MTDAQDKQRYKPSVGGSPDSTRPRQPCRILARPSDAGHAHLGAWLLTGARVTSLAMMVFALGKSFTMQSIYEQ